MINKMKQKNVFFLFLLYCLSKNSLQQPIIIPIEPGLDVEHNENNNNDNEQDGDQPIVITKEIKGNDGQHIKITRIHYHKTKHLNGNSEAITPFQIIRIFDNRVNSIFEDIIRQSLGFRSFFNMVEDSEDNDTEDDTEDTRQKKINKRRNKKYNKKDGIDNIFDEIEKQFNLVDENENKTNNGEENKNKENDDNDNKKDVVSKDTKSKNEKKSNEKSKANPDLTKSSKKKKKLSRKQLIFSRVCKYIFYMI